MIKSRIFKYMTLVVLCGWGLFSCGTKTTEPVQESVFSISYYAVDPISNANIRGLYLLNDKVGWASGSAGTFMRMTDGANWLSDTITGYTHLDFRDVHAFDANTALLMASDDSSLILKTEDAGKSWAVVMTHKPEASLFLDGMDFSDGMGYFYGDPLKEDFVIGSFDKDFQLGGSIHEDSLPNSYMSEAGFAASGTGLVKGDEFVWFGTGGSAARVFRGQVNGTNWKVFDTPIRSGKGCGIFSLAKTNQNVVAVGGCYLDSTSVEANCAVSRDWGKTWELITENQPRGYRSCVAYAAESNLLVACGRTGIEYSLDEGFHWIPISDQGYYTCSLVDSTGWLMGRGGKMTKLSW